jgi:hypothetical protein
MRREGARSNMRVQPFGFAQDRLPRGLALLGALTSLARLPLTRHPLDRGRSRPSKGGFHAEIGSSLEPVSLRVRVCLFTKYR